MTPPDGWETRALADFIELQRGFDLPHRARRPGPHKVLSSGEAHGWHDVAKVVGPGFVVGRATNIGKPTWSDDDFWPLNTTLFAKDFKGNDPKFAYYWFLGHDLSAYNSGSVQPMLNRNYIAGIPINVPPLGEQRAIAATLGALDAKIESNRHVIDMAPRLVRARVEASLSEEATPISISELATFVNGGAYTKGASGTGRMVVRIAELNSGPGRSTVYNNIDVPEDKTANAGDILMAWSGSLGVHRWYRDEAIINQHIFKVIPNEYPAWLVFDRVNVAMPVFRGLAADKATTMGHIQRGHLTSTQVPVPTGAAIARLDADLESLWERILLAETENLRLSRLRDTLLPELLSGRIRTPVTMS